MLLHTLIGGVFIMIKKFKSIDKFNAATVFLIAIYVISLIPILYAAFYSHPTADDFSYSIYVHKAFLSGGNIIDILGAAFRKISESYFNWQGTFSAIFIFSLQPAAFSENLYFITAFIMIGALSFSTYFLFDTIIVKICKSKKAYSLFISTLVLIFNIQFIFDLRQGVYWFNGSSYYTLFYCFALLMFSVLFRMYISARTKQRMLLFIPALFLAFFIGGGNYSTALCSVCLMMIFIFFVIKEKKEQWYIYVMIFIVLLAGFIVSMAAPGNLVRGEYFQSLQMSPVKAVISSVLRSAVFISEWTTFAHVILFIVITPILFKISKNVTFEFKFPLIVLIVSFLCFATQLTPPLYAMGTVGSGRQVNIYKYSYYLLFLLNIFYMCGWLNHRLKFSVTFGKEISKYVKVCISGVLVFLMGIGIWGYYDSHSLPSVETAKALIEGKVQQYDIEYKNIVEKIKKQEDYYIEDISDTPRFFGNFEFDGDPQYWTNKSVALYYDAKLFSLKK